MGIYMEHFRCVELVSEKAETSGYPTRWGAASVPYIIKGNARMATYWLAAGVLTLALTWLKE